MHRYRKTYRLVSLVLLACLITALGGASAGFGHDCCGHCGQASQPHPMHAATVMASNNCCADQPACSCELRSTDDTALPAYSLVRVNPVSDNPATGATATVSGTVAAPDYRPPAAAYRLSGSQTGFEPLYLTYQSFLC